jgi:LysR family transcriptional regulator, regulator for metE and metH
VLELRHLKTLVALAETGNLSKAGRRLNLSQPAVSHQIRAVEEHYGIEFFERKSDPLGLTAAGQLLVNLAYDITRRMRDGERELARIAQGQATPASTG